MYKLALLSIVLASLFIPVLLARDPFRRRGLLRALILVAIFNFGWVLFIVVLFPDYTL